MRISSSSTTETLLTIHAAGYCTNNERITLSESGQFKTIRFPSMFSLIRQFISAPNLAATTSQEGKQKLRHILFDTGYSTDFYRATAHCPYCLYAHATPVTVHPNESASQQLMQQYGIEPHQVDYIVISHFHADHIGALSHFPCAKFICLQSGYEQIRNRKGLSAVSCGFLPDLLPKDFDQRVILVQDGDDENDSNCGEWSYLYNTNIRGKDLFGDQTVFIVQLPGHHFGHCGLLVHAQNEESYLLVGDACWSSTAFKRNELPSIVTKYLVHDNWEQYKETLRSIHNLHQAHPSIKIIPSHCQEIYEQYCSDDPSHNKANKKKTSLVKSKL